MIKKYFFLFFVLCVAALAVCGCKSDSDDDYSNAESYYTPSTGRKVAAIKTTATQNDHNYLWNYAFTYDTKGRIARIDGTIHYYSSNQKSNCVLTTCANYLYYKIDQLKITYTCDYNFTDNTQYNKTLDGTYYGTFTQAGTLSVFGAIACEYSSSKLTQVDLDDGRYYQPIWEKDDVTGYLFKATENGEWVSYTGKYKFSNVVNSTNIDFSAFFGNLPFEIETLPCNGNFLFSPFYLGAFDMLGARSLHLPLANYTYDSEGYPVKAVHTTAGGLELTREITYLQ